MPRPAAIRVALLTGLALTLFVSSGCVFWRLSRLRGQLAEFSRYVEVDAAPGPTIRFLEPVLRPGDIAWLLNLPPGEVTTDGDTTEHMWTLRKRTAMDPEPEAMTRIECRVVALENRITTVSLPERFNEVVDQEILEKSFADSDQGAVDRKLYRTGWELNNTIGIPEEPELRAVLGSPCSLTETSTHRVLEYAYDVLRDGTTPGEGRADSTGQFTFSRTHGRLVLATVRFGIFTVRVISNDGQDYRITLQRGGSK